ncbi:MAG: AAA family ATPase [Kiritimatiellae bacterium]|nr:AAA family ATPase [Kiritimatiellia bacterium]
MYTEYWNLKCLPFENAPNPRFFYPSKGHREAITRMIFAIKTRKAMALVTGDYGSGKTVLCRAAIDKLGVDEYAVAFVNNPRMDSLDITREISFQFGEEIPSRGKYEVLHAFNSILDRHAEKGKHCVAIIDEAQLIMDPATFEDLRLLLNHQMQDRFLLTLVFVGQSELLDRLRTIPQLIQRIALKFHIPSLGTDEVGSYVLHRLETAGGRGDIFSETAVKEIAKLSRGNPREINALCDMCMLLGSLTGKKQIGPEEVAEAGAERGA